MTTKPRLLETDAYPFEFISEVAERESWRKEIHRPIYHLHKWWAKRLGSIFRGILLGASADRIARRSQGRAELLDTALSPS